MEIDISAHLPEGHPISISVIGAGGTGSQVVMSLARIHVSLRALNLPGLHVTLWDGDKVSEANLGRQLFVQAEVGEFKARALMERVNRFFGTYWDAKPYKISSGILGTDISSQFVAKLIIGCVDNVKGRRVIREGLEVNGAYFTPQFTNLLWIDAGNDLVSGQVIIGSKILGIPDVLDVFPNIEDDESKNDTPSCSLAEALGKQHLFINPTIANLVGMAVWDIAYHQKLYWKQAFVNLGRGIMTSLVKFDNNGNQVQIHQERRSHHHQESKETGAETKYPSRRHVRGHHKSGKRKTR